LLRTLLLLGQAIFISKAEGVPLCNEVSKETNSPHQMVTKHVNIVKRKKAELRKNLKYLLFRD
jgi:hypothetical protein